MNNFLLKEIARMKNLTNYERGRVISEQKTILLEVDDATWKVTTDYFSKKNAGTITTNPNIYKTTSGVEINKDGSWTDTATQQRGTWSVVNNVPVDNTTKKPLDAPSTNVTSQTNTVQIGPLPANQTEADAFKVWLRKTQPNFVCTTGKSKGLKISTKPNRKYNGPCFKDAWSKFGKDFKSSPTSTSTIASTASTATTASTPTTSTTLNLWEDAKGTSLPDVFSQIAAKMPESGFTTFIYFSAATEITGIGSNMTKDALIQKLGDVGFDASKFQTPPNPPSSGIYTKDYASQLKQPEQQPQQDLTDVFTPKGNEEIKTMEQAQTAIELAKQTAEDAKKQNKLDKQVCRAVGKALNPVMPFSKGVTSPALCEKLWQCMDQNFIVRGDEKFIEACPRPTTPPAT